MRNIIILIAFYIIGITSVFAQSETDNMKTENKFFRFNMKEKISYEIRAGLIFSTLSTTIPESSPTLKSEFEKSQTKLGCNIEILANLPFLESVYFQTGLKFPIGKIYTVFGVEFPFLISYRKNITENLKWDLNGGGGFGIMLRSNKEFYSGEFTLILGTGLYYKKCYFGLYADFGLNDVYKGRNVMQSNKWWDYHRENMIAKISVVSITAGYKF